MRKLGYFISICGLIFLFTEIYDIAASLMITIGLAMVMKTLPKGNAEWMIDDLFIILAWFGLFVRSVFPMQSGIRLALQTADDALLIGGYAYLCFILMRREIKKLPKKKPKHRRDGR